MLGDAERVRQPRFRRAWPQRFLLAFVRRPARKPGHLEGGAHAPVGVGEALGIDARRRGAALRGAAAFCGGDAAHCARPRARRSRIRPNGSRVARRDGLDVRDRQGEAGALQERAEVAHVGEGRDAGARAALQFGLGLRERLTQLGQRRAARTGSPGKGRPASGRAGSGSARPAGRSRPGAPEARPPDRTAPARTAGFLRRRRA